MVIGLFATPDAAGQCLTNLEEADFQPRDISVVMKSAKEAADLAIVSGSLSGLSIEGLAAQLTHLGLPADAVNAYRDGIARGGVFVAVAAGAATTAAKEMLEDAGARDVRVIGSA